MGAEEGYGQEREQDYRRIVATIGGVLLLLLLACLLWWLLSQRADVPDVVGMKKDDAAAAILKAGFAVGDIATQTALPGEAGKIIDQLPEGGRRAFKGSDIDLVLAVTQAAGGHGGPAIGAAGTPDTGEPEVFFVPPAGTGVEAPDVVYTATPDNSPRIPNALGMTLSSAEATLAAHGYGYTVKHGPVSTTVPAGRVYFQDPPPETYAALGTVVVIWLATDESPTGYTLPTD